jgi:hypothetical protein
MSIAEPGRHYGVNKQTSPLVKKNEDQGHREQVWVQVKNEDQGHREQVWVQVKNEDQGHREQVWVQVKNEDQGHREQVWVQVKNFFAPLSPPPPQAKAGRLKIFTINQKY